MLFPCSAATVREKRMNHTGFTASGLQAPFCHSRLICVNWWILTHRRRHDPRLHFDLDDSQHDGAVVALGQRADDGAGRLLDPTVVRLLVLLEGLHRANSGYVRSVYVCAWWRDSPTTSQEEVVKDTQCRRSWCRMQEWVTSFKPVKYTHPNITFRNGSSVEKV